LSARAYSVSVEGFSGPLDALLSLIERREIEITTISLAIVTDDFVSYVRAMDEVDSNELSRFVAVAARLLQIKALALFPRHRSDGEEEDSDSLAEDLIERLRAYQMFRRAAEALRDRESRGLRSYASLMPPVPGELPAPALQPGTTRDLVRAMQRVIARTRTTPIDDLPREAFTIGGQMDLLRRRLATTERFTLRALLRDSERSAWVATFLALLELMRLGIAHATQASQFDDIELSRAG